MANPLSANTVQVGAANVLSGAADPTAGAGVAASVGSVYMRTTGALYQKTGAGDTAWTLVGAGGTVSVNELWAPRITPHAADDEFNTNAINAAWSQTGMTALDFANRPAPYVNPVTTNRASWENLRGPDNSSADALAANTWLRMQPAAGRGGLWKRLDSAAFGGAVPATLLAWCRYRFGWANGAGAAGGDYEINLTFFQESGAGFSEAVHASVGIKTQAPATANTIKPVFWGRNGGVAVSNSEGIAWNGAGNLNQQTFFSGYLALQKRNATTYSAWWIDDGGRLFMGSYVDAGLTGINAVAIHATAADQAMGACIFDIDFIRFYQGVDWIP